jgi:hypothetical protein
MLIHSTEQAQTVLERSQQHATNTLRLDPHSRLHEIRGLETAKASRGDPRPCLWGAHRARQESEPRARPPQAVSLRLVPSSVNGPRPRLNRLSEGLIEKAQPENAKSPGSLQGFGCGRFLTPGLHQARSLSPRRRLSCAVLSRRQFTLTRLWPRCPAALTGTARTVFTCVPVTGRKCS